MKIAVLIKQTPDTAELPKVSADAVRSGLVHKEGQATMVINPWDEFAAEEAIQLSERFDADTVAITLGAPGADAALRHALAMGVGGATLVDTSGIAQADMWATAEILAAAVQAESNVDLVLTGKQSVDENSGSVFVGVARRLGWPLLANVVKIVDIIVPHGTGHEADGKITVERLVEGAAETVACTLPAVISVGKEINEPRYPNFMGIRKAGRAQIPTRTPAELGVDVDAPRVRWENIRKPETRKTRVQIIDGASAQEKAAKLVDALLNEKVI